MNPAECLEMFLKRCEATGKYSYATIFGLLIEELKAQVKTKKYDSAKVKQIASNIGLVWYRLLLVNKLDVELNWIQSEWPKAVAVAQGASVVVVSPAPSPSPSPASVLVSAPSPSVSLQPSPSPAPTPVPTPVPSPFRAPSASVVYASSPLVLSASSPLVSAPSSSASMASSSLSASPVVVTPVPRPMPTPAPSISLAPAPVVSASPALASVKTDSRIAEFAALASKWGVIKITDLPTSTPGVYIQTEDDKMTIVSKAAAAGAVIKEGIDMAKVLESGRYWLRLGRMVLKGKKGRCFSCAAVAAYLLTLEPAFDDLDICIWGSGEYDHHFTTIGKSSEYASAWNGVVVIDIWHGNLNKETGVYKYANFPYKMKVSGGYKRFAWLSAAKRAQQRSYAIKLDGEKD